jgi:phage-related protein
MPVRHTIVFFVQQNEECPVQDYLFSGNETALNTIIHCMQYLSYVGQAIFDTNMAKPINDHKPLCELRKDRHRIFFAYDRAFNRYIMLNAFIKKTQKTPPEEIAQAEKNWHEYLINKRVIEFDIPLDFTLSNL